MKKYIYVPRKGWKGWVLSKLLDWLTSKFEVNTPNILYAQTYAERHFGKDGLLLWEVNLPAPHQWREIPPAEEAQQITMLVYPQESK